MLLTGCIPTLGDPLPRPVAMGRAADGRFRFVVPLCGGETVSAIEVVEHQTERLVWRASRPTRPEIRHGVIVVGDEDGFAEQETPLREPLPSNISVSVRLSSGIEVGRGFLLAEVPERFASSGEVDHFGDAVTDDEFREQVTGEYC
ncbi:hypothetical protein [Nonomuraea maritima]|uniref:hypothetical protein n=1 Tax=Nonomuraea maritima TaxID=683260 RepID=UPI00371AA516